MQLNEADTERFEEMTHRLELTHVWTELGSLVSPGWLVLPGRGAPTWRAYPIARVKGAPRDVSTFAGNLLREVTGFQPLGPEQRYRVSDVELAQDKALRMLLVFSPAVHA